MSNIEEILHHLDDEVRKFVKEKLRIKSDRIAELEKENNKLKIALELAAIEYIDFHQSLIEDGIIEGFIFTDIEFVKQSFVEEVLTDAQKYLEVDNGKF